MSKLLNISNKLDKQSVELIHSVHQVLSELGVPYLVVGATARNFVLHYGYGAAVERATGDVDFAISIPGWEIFNEVKRALVENGFRSTKRAHRFVNPENSLIDIVPFGGIENEDALIAWPPAGDVVMNMLGFHEALESAQVVRIQQEPELDIPIVMPPELALLKLIAWTDRASDLRIRDAKDLAYLFMTYEKIEYITDEIYSIENTEVMDGYDWDITLGATYLLGKHVAAIARGNTKQYIEKLINEELKPLNLDLLAEEMCENVEVQFERRLGLLSAFIDGFKEENEPNH